MVAPLLLSGRDSPAAQGSGSGSQSSSSGPGSQGSASSPPTRPWLSVLPRKIVPLNKVDALFPLSELEPKSENADPQQREAGRPAHQHFEVLERLDGTDLYEISAQAIPWQFHPDYPPSKQIIWTYQSTAQSAGPTPTFPLTILARYGRPIICRFHSRLAASTDRLVAQGFVRPRVGSPEISTHLHNLHASSGCDGFPSDFYSAADLRDASQITPGEFKDHLYHNVYAGYLENLENPGPFTGYAANGQVIGDYREGLGTLWFHDHTKDFTAPNTYLGLAGFYLIFDEFDSGDELDPNPRALRLPSGAYDYPLAFGDKRFDANGLLFWNELGPEGVLGDKVTVNGKIEPVLPVDARKYRLRLLNTGPSRFYEFYLVDASGKDQRFDYLASDGNLLPQPLRGQTKVRLAVAERADIVVDFSKYPIGTELYLVNRLQQDSTRQPNGVQGPGTRVLKIVVDRNPDKQDLSQVPNLLRPLRELPTAAELNRLPKRRWEFDRQNGMWTINNKLFDAEDETSNIIPLGATEVWELSGKGGWDHPVHIHLEEGRILSKSSGAVPPHERGRKDVFVLEGSMTIRLLVRFRDFTGKYVMHCHNVIHEDHEMMVRLNVVDTST
ncbi:bilirubin oxidase [Pseudomonas taiwanensis]|nr:bilirubin oxidase [Pseudomonas taiwanensis]